MSIFGKRRSANSFWRFSNWKMWAAIFIVPVVAFMLFRLIRAQLRANERQAVVIKLEQHTADLQSGSSNIQTGANAITTNKGVQASTQKIIKDLGTNYTDSGNWLTDILNPSGWTENDKAVADEVIYQRENFALIKRLYTFYTRNHDLTYDLNRWLDADQLARLKKYNLPY